MNVSEQSLIQRVYRNSGSNIARSFHLSSQTIDASKYYFQLEVIPQLETLLQTDNFQQTVNLNANQIYNVRVLVDSDPDGRTALHPVTLTSDIELYLFSSYSHVQVEPIFCLVPQNIVDGAIFEFRLIVASEYTGVPVTLSLNYRRVGASINPIEISRYEVSVSGDRFEQDATVLKISLDRQIAEQVRILHVESIDDSLFYIRAYWNEEVEFSAKIPRPAISPASYIMKEDLPRDIINKIRAKSANNPIPFIRWLKSHLMKYGRNFNLIIHDDSEHTDTAWELIHINLQLGEFPELPKDLIGQVPIGAIITMTRWLPGLHWYDIEHELTIVPTESKGHIVACLDHDQTLPNSHREHAALLPFIGQKYTNINQFKERLVSNLSNIALVYIGCHGIIVNEIAERNFILGRNNRAEIKVYDLAELPYIENIASRPIVIVNACNSAWLFRNDNIRYGLPVAFLQHIAKDFIGTIGPVGDKSAAHIAESIFKAIATNKEGVCLASLLRDLRAEAFRYLSKVHIGDEEWFDYLFTFMYVYYGNPYSRLNLLLCAESNKVE